MMHDVTRPRCVRISTCYLPVGSEWLHVGTDKGSILFFNAMTFARSSLEIMWNQVVGGYVCLFIISCKSLEDLL